MTCSAARTPSAVFTSALEELQDGRRPSRWMWFILPQSRGLGSSEMAHRFGVSSLDEVRACLRHPVLGERRIACLPALDAHTDTAANRIPPR